jgi:hypothetical protein
MGNSVPQQLLGSWHVVLPAASTIERLVDSVSAHAKEEFFEFISSRLSKDLKKKIDQLLVQTGTDGKTDLFHLKEYPPSATATHILIPANLAITFGSILSHTRAYFKGAVAATLSCHRT